MRLTAILRRAGILTYPPVMNAAICKWVDQVIAGHTLARAESAISRLTENSNGAKPDEELTSHEAYIRQVVREAKDAAHKYSESDKRPLRADDTIWSLLTTDAGTQIGVLQLQIYDNHDEHGHRYMGVSFIPGVLIRGITWPLFYKYREPEGGAGIVGDHIDKAIETAAAKARAHVRDLLDRDRSKPKPNEIHLVELSLLQRECRRYTAKAKEYSSKTSKVFDVDLSGWPYLPKTLEGAQHKRLDQTNKDAAQEFQKQQQVSRQSIEHLLSAVKRLRVPGETTKEYPLYSGSGNKTLLKVKLRQSTMFASGGGEARQTTDYILLEGNAFGGDYSTVDALRQFLEGNYIPSEKPKTLAQRVHTDVNKFLRDITWHEITVVLSFMPHTKRGGQWNDSTRTLEVDTRADTSLSVESFRAQLAQAHGTVRHELQHLSQSYIGVLAGLRTPTGYRAPGGLPSPRVREKEFSPYGIRTQDKPKPKKTTTTKKPAKPKQELEHERRDIEFHTDLGNALEAFVKQLPQVAKTRWGRFFQEFTGEYDGRDTYKFFRTWKDTNLPKWKTAVRELLKALADRGITITGRDKSTTTLFPPVTVISFSSPAVEKKFLTEWQKAGYSLAKLQRQRDGTYKAMDRDVSTRARDIADRIKGVRVRVREQDPESASVYA